jgi:hypothetical protein
VREDIHQTLEFENAKPFLLILFDVQDNLGSSAQSISSGVWEDLEFVA